MKKTKLFGWALFASMISLSACSYDAEEVFAQENEIKLTSEITPSRVTSLDYQSTQIVKGQQVGVTITGAKSEHKNVAWNVGEEGELSNTGDPVYYGDGSATITAYHPFNDDWDENTSYAFSVNTDQSSEENYRNSDLLWAAATSSKTETAIPLIFSHKLAKINVTLKSEDIEDLSGATISICGTNITTNFDPVDGTLSAATANIQEIKASVTTSTAYTASAIVVPQTVAGGTKFIKIAHNDRTFYYTLSTNKELKSGYSHNYTLTIKEKEVTTESDKITDWEDDDNIGDAEEVNVIPNNEIWYTTTDESIINMANHFDFGVTIKSNTYEKGKGVIKFNGDVTQLETQAFFEEEKLTTITIPQSVGKIHNENYYGIFLGCNNLASIDVDSKNNNFSSKDGVLYNKNKTELIRYPSAKEGNFTIPKSVTAIRHNTFYFCKNLSNITIHNGVISIGYNAFQYSGLTTLTIPGSIDVIESGTFGNCKSLENVTISDGVTSIGSSAFKGCSSLTTIVLPSSCQEIKASFYGCSTLSNIYIPAAVPPIIYDVNNLPSGHNLAFEAFDSSIYNSCKVYVPKGSKNAYKEAYGWGNFTNIIEIE